MWGNSGHDHVTLLPLFPSFPSGSSAEKGESMGQGLVAIHHNCKKIRGAQRVPRWGTTLLLRGGLGFRTDHLDLSAVGLVDAEEQDVVAGDFDRHAIAENNLLAGPEIGCGLHAGQHERTQA